LTSERILRVLNIQSPRLSKSLDYGAERDGDNRTSGRRESSPLAQTAKGGVGLTVGETIAAFNF
jgi:hypothetical protein